MGNLFPIAETFDSIQGEGLYTGTRMFFIRFAGCSVGKKIPVSEKGSLPIYAERCTTYDGRSFVCDTDFRTKETLTLEQLMDRIPKGVEHICITGGEPLIQPLEKFFDYVANNTPYKVHIETSGTIDIRKTWPSWDPADSYGDSAWLWITVSPKLAVLPEMLKLASEIKLLVDDGFDLEKLPKEIFDHDLVYLSPINEEFSLNKDNLNKCIKILSDHPKWRLAMQAHKVWGVR